MKKQELSSSEQESLAMKFWLRAVIFFFFGSAFGIISVLTEGNAFLLGATIIFAVIGLVFLVLSAWVMQEREPDWLRKAEEQMKKK